MMETVQTMKPDVPESNTRSQVELCLDDYKIFHWERGTACLRAVGFAAGSFELWHGACG
jgi:hypothetical protein